MNKLQKIKNLQSTFLAGKPIYSLFCDIQPKFSPLFGEADFLSTIDVVAETSNILGFKQIITEQKPTVFGNTCAEVMRHKREDALFYTKSTFSMFSEDQDILKTDAPFIITGIMAHVCVFQTATLLLNKGKDVFLVADAVTSTKQESRRHALQLLSDLGTIILGAENLFFLLLQDSNHPKFKTMLPIIKKVSQKDSPLLMDTFI